MSSAVRRSKVGGVSAWAKQRSRRAKEGCWGWSGGYNGTGRPSPYESATPGREGPCSDQRKAGRPVGPTRFRKVAKKDRGRAIRDLGARTPHPPTPLNGMEVPFVRWRAFGLRTPKALSPCPPGVQQAAKGPIVCQGGTWEIHGVVPAREVQSRQQARKCQRTPWRSEAA